MRAPATAIAGVLALLAPLPAWAGGVGYTDVDFRDDTRDRPVEVRVWYPSTGERGDAPTRYDVAFRGNARENGPFVGNGPRPLVMLSHGDRGSNVDQSWLAEALAGEGYVVAAISHWQNTWKQNTPEATIKVWDRPRDVSVAISRLVSDPVWGPRLDAGRIAAAGHSAGGYTALALAGAIYSPLQMAEYCAAQHGVRECRLGDGADIGAIDFSEARLSHRDPRVKVAVAMAPALGPGIDPASLAAIRIPVLTIAARDDELLTPERNAVAYANRTPGAQLVLLDSGGHFAFMPECTVMGRVFTYFHRFDICGRRSGLDQTRPALHARIERTVIEFLNDHLINDNRHLADRERH